MSKITEKTFVEAVDYVKSVDDFCRVAVDQCYEKWKQVYGQYTEQYFSDHLEVKYGIKLDKSGGYYVVDERKYLLFRLKYSESCTNKQAIQGPY